MTKNIEQKFQAEKKHLEIEIGSKLQVQIGQFYSRLESTLIGIHKRKYLVITMLKGSKSLSLELKQDGTPLIIRYIHNGKAYGFKSIVLDVLTNLENHLIISYPAQVEIHELRNFPRLSCFLPARLFIDNKFIDSSVSDISRTGVQYTLSTSEDIEQLAEHVDEKISLDVQLPGSDGYTHIIANICNIRENNNRVSLGITFDQSDTQYLTNLISFLLDAKVLPKYQKLSKKIHKHYEWIEKVCNYIHAEKDQEQDFALSPDECNMGKWLNSVEKSVYTRISEFQELDKIHQNLHLQIKKAIELRMKGKKEESIKFLNSLNIEHISHKISAILIVIHEKQSNIE